MADDTLNADGGVAAETGRESSLSNWAGDYVTGMLGEAEAISDLGYQGYGGPLTAGSSDLQDSAFEGVANLAMPTDMGVGGYQTQGFTGASPDIAAYGAEGGAGIAGLENTGLPPNLIEQYMNPYLRSALDPQIADARRQSEIDRVNNASRMTKAGSFGGSRQAVLDAENQSALQRNIAGITGAGYRDAYDKATNQFNLEQDRGMTAQDKINDYGLTTLGAYTDLGGIQRDIESEGILADKMQFEEERDYPYKDIQFKSSLLSGLPITAMDYNYKEPSYLQTLAADAGDFESFFKGLLGDGFSKNTDTKTETS